MPPKGKGKKTKGGKKSKSLDPDNPTKEKEILTFNEAVLLYQLQAKQQQHNDVNGGVEDLERRIKRQKERNNILKQERQKYMKEAIRQAKEKELESQNKVEVEYEEVEVALKDKLQAGRQEEQTVKELKSQISESEEEISRVKIEVKKCCDYRDHSQYVNETHIKLLKGEMKDMRESYEELSGFFVKNLENIKEQIIKSTRNSIDKEKLVASEQALDDLDTSSHQEFSDNKWLRQEVEIHEKHLADISALVEELEKQNVEMMGGLLESQFEDVKITKDFFDACEDSESEDDAAPQLLSHDNNKETENVIALRGDVSGEEDDPTNIDWLDNYIPTFDEDSTEGMLRLAPMDLKLLCIVGTRKAIHQYLTEKEREEMDQLHADDSHRRLDWLDNDVLLGHATKF